MTVKGSHTTLVCQNFTEASQGNVTGAAFYNARAATIRSAMNTYLLAAGKDHYCTQSDPAPGGGVNVRGLVAPLPAAVFRL